MIRYFLLSFPRPPGSIPLRSFPRSIPHALFSPVLSFHPLFTWQRCMHGTSNERVHLFSSRPLSGRASSLSNFVFSISHAVSDGGGICFSSSSLPLPFPSPYSRCPSLASLGLCDVMRGRVRLRSKPRSDAAGNTIRTLLPQHLSYCKIQAWTHVAEAWASLNDFAAAAASPLPSFLPPDGVSDFPFYVGWNEQRKVMGESEREGEWG